MDPPPMLEKEVHGVMDAPPTLEKRGAWGHVGDVTQCGSTRLQVVLVSVVVLIVIVIILGAQAAFSNKGSGPPRGPHPTLENF